VIWDFVGEPISPELTADLAAIEPRLRAGDVRDRLLGLLSDAEVEAAHERLARLLATGRFPEPGPGRPYPWPVV
jgi:hypothetical protein